MPTKRTRSSQRLVLLFAGALLLFAAALHLRPVDASSTASATKDCSILPCTSSTSGTFTLATDQVVVWEANFLGGGGAGNAFFIHHNTNPALDEIPLSTSLHSGFNTGTQFLGAGTYEISITYFRMGSGSYSIIFDRTATMGIVPPTSHSFGSVLAGASSATFPFTIRKTGDLDVTISSVVSSDSHFAIISAPIGQVVGPNRTFQVRFDAGATAGPFSATITISASSSITVTPVTVTVSGTTIPNVPNISCAGGSCGAGANLGTADGDAGATPTFSMSFQNSGTAPLNLTSITLINDSPASPFSLAAPPSTAPVTTGGSRTVQIRFAPPPGEATYCGHLVIQSNDPDEPTKVCFFRARAHHPVPRMRLESTTLNYRQVELGFSFTKAIVVHNDGDAPLNVTVSDICSVDPACAPFISQWFSQEMGGPFTIAPGGLQAFRDVYRPQVLGTHTIRQEVSGNDPANPNQVVTLTGEGIAPIPIDTVLALDRSLSMNDPAGPPRRKIDALQTAADMYVHLLRPETGSGTGDKIGLVRYNDVNDVYLPLGFMTPNNAAGTQLALAEDKLSPAAVADTSRLGPSGATGIGGAIQTSASMLLPPSTTRKHVMILLTDGQENRTPFISDVLGPVRSADPAIKMYSIGLGTQIDPARLQLITNVAHGFHQVADDLSGTSRFDLETFYFKIFANATGMSLALDPTSANYVNGTNPIVVQTAHIVSSDRTATFLVLDDPALRAFYNLELIDPLGQIIVLGATVGGIPVQQSQRFNYTLYKVIFPDESLAASYAGDWILRLTPNGKWSPAAAREALSQSNQHGQDFINPFQGLVPIGFAVAVGSDYRMDVNVLPSNYLPGADVKLTAALSDRGAPSVSGEVIVDAKTPGGTNYPGLRLYDDGTHGDADANDGVFTTHFVQTAETGSYRFFFRANGRNERGELVPREDTRYATLMQLTPNPTSDTGCIPCRWLWILWILLILLLLFLLFSLLRCCRTLHRS